MFVVIPLFFKDLGINLMSKDEIDNIKLGGGSSPSSPSTEVIYMYLMQYGINLRDYDYHRENYWFKKRFREIREECILI